MNQVLGEDIAHLADDLPDAVFLVDDRDRINYVSAACESIFGYKPAEMLGHSIIDFVVPEDRDETLAEAAKVISGRQKRVGFENRYQHQDGSHIHLMWSARWIESRYARIGVARDVTALRQKPVSSQGTAPLLELLSPREREVLAELLTCAAEKQIAAKLGLAASTTHAYITAIFRKLDVRSRAGLMSLWISLLQPPAVSTGGVEPPPGRT